METIKQKLINWWNNGEQDKPIIIGSFCSMPFPEIPDMAEYWKKNSIRYKIFTDMLEKTTSYGCDMKTHYIDFGASAMAGALGCKMNPLTFDTIWPSHMFDCLPNACDIELKVNDEWYKTIHKLLDISLANEEVMTTFFALGGVNDTLGNMYGEQNLLIDMYDEPKKLHNCLEKICNIWIVEKEKMWKKIKEKQDGMSSWAGIWAPGSTYPIQDDISYMLSKEMFLEFCLPYIKKCIDSLDYPIYHLDGPGAIQHLDELLKIDNLPAIQWIAGAGNEDMPQWYSLIKKILDANKSVQVYCRVDEVEDLINAVGTKGLLIKLWDANPQNIETIKRYL